jgi:tetratricopeptide (TPR) repeat protein
MIARCLEKRGERREAAAALQQALKSALRGRSTSEGVLASRVSSRLPLQDSRHAPTYANLARLEARLGNVGAAVAALRLAILGGYRRPIIHARLARLYALERRWRAAIAEAGRAIALVPAAWARAIARTWTAVVVRLEALA